MALRNAFENLATEAKQTTIIGHVDGIEALLTTIDADTSNLSVVGGGTETGALRVTIANNSTGVLSIDDNGGSITVDGTVAVTGTFWQATQPVSIAASVAVTGPLTDTQLRATAVPVSIASVPSHAVTNAGTFAVQVSSSLPTGSNTIGAVNIAAAQTLATVTTVGTVTTCNLASDDTHDGVAGSSVVMNGGYAYGIAVSDNTLPTVSANTDAARLLTNKNGALAMVNLPESCKAYAPSNATTTAYANSLVVKSSPGTLYMVTGYNSSNSDQFIQIHDASSLPSDGATPKIIFFVPSKNNFSFDLGQYGRFFDVGIVICTSSTGSTKAIGTAADCWIDAQYV